MTGSRILLDTSVIIDWLRGEQLIADKIDKASKIYIPIIVLGELYYGAQYSLNIRTNLANINKVVKHYELLNTTAQTAVFYSILKANYEARAS